MSQLEEAGTAKIVDWCDCPHGVLLKRRWDTRDRAGDIRFQAIEEVLVASERLAASNLKCDKCHGFGLIGPPKLVAYKLGELRDGITEAEAAASQEAWMKLPMNRMWDRIIDHLSWPESAVLRKHMLEGESDADIAVDMSLTVEEVFRIRVDAVDSIQRRSDTGEGQTAGNE